MDDPQRRSLDELTSTLAHELVAPLSVIGSAAALLGDGPVHDQDADEVAEIVATIARNVELAQLVVDGMRNRGQEGADIPVQRRDTDVAELARSAIDDLQRTLLRDHPTQVEAPATLVAHVDPLRTRQVLFNLLSNAAKFSDVDRQIRLLVTPLPDGRAELTVRDRGHGVAPEDAERIFEKWTRADVDADVSGLGLGLHLARAIARAQGGDLTLEEPSDSDGAVFVLTVPAAAGTTSA